MSRSFLAVGAGAMLGLTGSSLILSLQLPARESSGPSVVLWSSLLIEYLLVSTAAAALWAWLGARNASAGSLRRSAPSLTIGLSAVLSVLPRGMSVG